MKQVWREGILAWSTVNLMFFRRWSDIFSPNHEYFLAAPASAAQYLSLMVLVVLLSAAAWGLATLVRRSGDRRLTWGLRGVFLLVVALAVYNVLLEAWIFVGRPHVQLWVQLIPWVVAAGSLAWMQWRHRGWHHRVLPVAVGAMLLLAPLVPILYVQGIHQAATVQSDADRYNPPLEGHTDAGESSHRVVWVLLDELDQRLAFEDRPDHVELPELDRLREQGLYATHAYAANEATLRAVPSMTTGQIVSEARPQNADTMFLELHDGPDDVDWGKSDTVFQQAHEQNHTVGIVGTYHPYCRLFADSLTSCAFTPHRLPSSPSFMAATREHVSTVWDTIPTLALQRGLAAQLGMSAAQSEQSQGREIAKYESLAPPAIEAAQDADLDFVYLHLNIPHPAGPTGHGRGFFDAEAGRLATGPEHTYFDNLELADRFLGEMRSAMQEAGVWENTTVVVSSDHGYRTEWWGPSTSGHPSSALLLQKTDHRVVFLAKPGANDTGNVTYNEGFNLVLLRDMVLHGLNDGFQSSAEMAAWLDEHRTFAAGPKYDLR